MTAWQIKGEASVKVLTMCWFSLLLNACVNLAAFDQHAYENATRLKAATLAMVDKSTQADSYSAQQLQVDALLVDLSAAYEYAKGFEHNSEAAGNWRDLIGDEESMVKGWLAQWQSRGQVSAAFLPEIQQQLSEGFDTIICLEANKRQLSSCDALKRADLGGQ